MFRRRILIQADPASAQPRLRAALEDDFHHFRVELQARDGHIASVRGEALRLPYTLCGEAPRALQALVDAPLSPVAHAVTRVTDPTGQCTHLLELAGLAMAAAANGLASRRYDIEVPMRTAGRTQGRLWRDGQLLLSWDLVGTVIEAPAAYAGIDIYHGMARWALAALPTDEAEAALVLRRAVGISKGRGMPLDEQVHAQPTGHCYSQQPVRAVQALRMRGSTWDFATTPERLCAGDVAWLAFA